MSTSISSALGAGSGIDTVELVKNLVDAQFAAKNTSITKRTEALAAQVSSVSTLKSGISAFASALSSLISGGSLATAPSSSNAAVVKATTIPGQVPGNQSYRVEVKALLAAQTSATAAPVAADAPVGAGTLRFSTGNYETGSFADSFSITTDASDTLTSVAAKINGAGRGISASIVADGTGQRLVLKGQAGASQAFRVAVSDADPASVLATLAVDQASTGSTIVNPASDARVSVDGVTVSRSTNSIADLVPGIRLDLQSAAIGNPATISSASPVASLKQAVEDVVATFNEFYAQVQEATNPVGGPLRSDPAASALRRSLGSLTLTVLRPNAAAGEPATLADLGVSTTRDGTLSVDNARLSAAIDKYPAAVEAIFAAPIGSSATRNGLAGALNAISASAVNKTAGLGASEIRYQRAQTKLTDEQADALEQAETVRTRMTQQFASMDSRVAAYKSAQTLLEQQIDAWNAQRN